MPNIIMCVVYFFFFFFENFALFAIIKLGTNEQYTEIVLREFLQMQARIWGVGGKEKKERYINVRC